MDYNFVSLETSKNLTKIFQSELNSIQRLTETITVQIRQITNDEGRTPPLLMRNESKEDRPILNIVNNQRLQEHFYTVVQSFLISLTDYIKSANEHLRVNHSSLITSPTLCNLSTVCSMLWKRVEESTNCAKKAENNSNKRLGSQIVKNKNKQKVAEDAKNFSQATQTENSCLTYCESCSLSTKFLKSLVQIILTEQSKYRVEFSQVSSYRDKIRTDLFEISQWGVMRGWIKAVEGDLQSAAAFLCHTAKELKRVKIRQEAEQKKYENSTKNLNDNLQMVKSQLEAEQAQNRYLTLQIENLNEALERRASNTEELKMSLNEQRNKFKDLMQSMDGIRNKITKLKETEENIKRIVKNTFTHEMSKLSEINKNAQLSIQLIEYNINSQFKNEKRNRLEMQMNICKKDEELNQLLDRFNASNEEKLKLKENNQSLNRALLSQKEEFTIKNNELQRTISELEKEINEKRQMKGQPQEIEKNPTFDFDVDISGNPVKDMEQQRLVNKQKIKALIRENESLKVTIQKLKGIRCVKSSGSSINR